MLAVQFALDSRAHVVHVLLRACEVLPVHLDELTSAPKECREQHDGEQRTDALFVQNLNRYTLPPVPDDLFDLFLRCHLAALSTAVGGVVGRVVLMLAVQFALDSLPRHGIAAFHLLDAFL